MSHVAVMYWDDGIWGAESFDQASIVSANVQADLCSLGFLVTADNVNGNQFKKSFGWGLYGTQNVTK